MAVDSELLEMQSRLQSCKGSLTFVIKPESRAEIDAAIGQLEALILSKRDVVVLRKTRVATNKQANRKIRDNARVGPDNQTKALFPSRATSAGRDKVAAEAITAALQERVAGQTNSPAIAPTTSPGYLVACVSN
jgi:hypothetical protein